MLTISLKTVEHRSQSAYAHDLLERAAGPIEDGEILLSEHGKPYFGEGGRQGLCFNLSHAKGITACLTAEEECGVDCECVRAMKMGALKKAYSPEERELVLSLPEGQQRDLMFFRLWTLKEAYVKAIGIGVSYPLEKVAFSFQGDRIVTDIEGYGFSQLIINGGRAVVSVCIKNRRMGNVGKAEIDEEGLEVFMTEE